MYAFDGVKGRELAKTVSDVNGKTRGFENSSSDVKEVKRLHTINEHLEGKTHATGVPFKKHRFTLNGERVEGVFPVFKSEFDCRLPRSLWKASDNQQFSMCTKMLQRRIESDPHFARKFTDRQREQIKNGEPRISGLTWHHNEIPGKMQLVNADDHAIARHTGGRSLWGGGASYR